MSRSNSASLIRLTAGIAVFLTVLVVFKVLKTMQTLSISLFQPKWFILWFGLAVASALGLALISMTWHKKSWNWLKNINGRILSLPAVKIVAIILSVSVLLFNHWFFFFSPVKIFLSEIDFFQTWLFWICGLVVVFILKTSDKKISLGKAHIIAFLGQSVIYKILSFLPRISSYPFALSWEENYRLYYASLVAAERIYGVDLPLSPVDFSLNLVNGIPFLLGDFSIWVHRLWYVSLWIGVAALTAYLLCRRLKIQDRLSRWLFTGWLFLYVLLEGGIKYHLLLSVVIILLGVSSKNPWRSLVSVVLASFWAGLSRVNWYPVPAMLAIALFLLESPVRSYRNLLHYLAKPFIWGLTGIGSSIIASLIVSRLPGAEHSTLEAMLTSDLLWYRLLPNPTYPPGILPAIVFISLPLWWISFSLIKGGWHPIRIIGLFAITFVLFTGGLIVSTKIGGGSDLHNLDSYLLLLIVISASIYFNWVEIDGFPAKTFQPNWLTITLLMTIPIWSALRIQQSFYSYDIKSTNIALQTLKYDVDRASKEGDVLFMYQRHLLTFGYIKVPVVPKYENVLILGMAMSRNYGYLDEFYKDISNHQFRLIVSEGQPKGLQDSSFAFGEENDVWFTAIAQPLLCYYERVATIPEGDVELYAPRSTIEDCEFTVP